MVVTCHIKETKVQHKTEKDKTEICSLKENKQDKIL